MAQDDTYTVWATYWLSVDAAHGLLANDRNLDGQALTAIVTSNPPHGSLILNAQGDFQFIPEAGFFGTTSFTYQASDGYTRSNTATVTITVNPTARITVVLDARPESPADLDFSGSLGAFWLDDNTVNDGDAYLNQRTFVVAPGIYTIKRNATSGWFNTAIVCTPSTGATIDLAQSSATLNLATNANVTCVFTVERGVNMNVRVFNDLVRTGTDFGVVNAGDPWLNGWLISLYLTPSNLVASRITSTNGFWWSREYEARFVNLRPGSYTVCTTLPTAAWVPSSPNAIDPTYGKPCKTITLAPGQGATLLFGAYQATVGASAAVTPDQEVITHVDQITDLPLMADEAAPVAPGTAEQSEPANALFLPLVVAGRDSALAESVPVPQEILHLDADTTRGDVASVGAMDLPSAQDESQDAGQSTVLDSPLGATPTVTAGEEGALPTHTLFLPLVTQ
ncbi:MAG: Ig-like domain-containing protein [Caldilineaceae bacterium]